MQRVSPYLYMTLGVCALGLAALSQAVQIRAPQFGYDSTGPGLFPIVASGMLIVSGAALSIRAWSGERPELDSEEAASQRAFDSLDFLVLVGGLVLGVVLFKTAGFIIAASVLFFATTLSFRSRHYVWNVIASVAFAVAVYLVFTQLLNVQLPPGILPI